jgi:hypothetical protein
MKKLSSISFQTIIRLFLQALAVLTFFVAVGWFIFEPGFEPLLAILASIAVFLSPLFLNLEEKVKDNSLVFADECDSVIETQLDALPVISAEVGGGGMENLEYDYQVYFGGRSDELAELDSWLTQTEKPFSLLVAPTGMGKTALVTNWSKNLQNSGQAVVVYHSISLRYGTNGQKQTLHSLLMQMRDVARKEADLVPERPYISGLNLIDESFNKEDLQELCFHLQVDFDNLDEGGKRVKATKLIQLCQRKGRLDELLVLCQEMRPHHDWNGAFSRSTPDRLLYEPPQEGDDERLLSSQLRENLRRSTGWSKPLVVIIDGLNELANQLNQSDIKPVDFLPNQAGEGIYILAVARGETNDVRDAWRRALGWEKSPVHHFVLGTLQKKDVREMVSRSRLGVENALLAQFVDKIYALSEEGDPLIASLWLDWLVKQEGKESASLLEDLAGQSPGINTYIEGILSQIDPLISDGAKPLFEALSLARGPLTVGDLYALGIKIDSGQLDRLVNLSGRLIIRNKYSYVIGHSRIRQAIQDKFVSPERREYWLEQFHRYGRCSLKQVSKTPDGKVPTYILSHYGKHLYLDKPTGYESSLYALVDKAWMQAHYEHSSKSYDDFLVDVDRALSVSKETGVDKVANGQSIDQIPLQIKGLLCHASINSLSSNLSPHLPALLVGDSIWKPQQAVFHVQRIADLTQRTHALVTLLTVEESRQIFDLPKNHNLRDVIISSGWRDIHFLGQQNKVDEAELYHLQLAISPFLSAAHVDEALLLAGKVQRSIWQAKLLAALLPLIEDERQMIQTNKKIIHACSRISESLCSEDLPFIIPTFTTLVQNLSMKQLAIAFAEIWGAESQIIDNQELVIAQAKDDPSVDEWAWRRLYNTRTEHIERRERKKRILDYLAWHIEKHQATAFVELLLEYDSLPQVAEKIGRFARRLDGEIAYDIAIRLATEYPSAPQEKRWFYGLGSMSEGIGMAFITLALSSKGEHQRKILQITNNYIQTYGAEDAPYGEQDLRLFYQMATGQLTDTEAADLVKQGEFMLRFWQDRGTSSKLSMYSHEIVAYLGAETLKVLFERCIESESTTTYWDITESPYILPAIAEKLPDEELTLIYEIGHSRGESCGYYGYVRSATENIERMTETVRLDTIQWALRGWASDTCLKQAIAPFITPNTIPTRYLRTKISASMARHLPPETVQYIVTDFDVSYYGEVKGTEVLLQFVQYLPENERKLLLQSMKAELFQIKDIGELDEMLRVLKGKAPLSSQKKLKRISWPFKKEMADAYLFNSLKKGESIFAGLAFFGSGDGFLRDGLGVLRNPNSLFRYAANQIRLLRLNNLSHLAFVEQQERREKEKRRVADLYSEPSGFIKLYYWQRKKLASSRLLWILSLLCTLFFAIILLPISILIALLTLPFLVLAVVGGLLLIVLELGRDWLKEWFERGKNDLEQHENKKDKAYIWESVRSQVHALNHLTESEAREDAFIQIVNEWEEIARLIGSSYYKEYADNAEEIWSELRPEFVLDALAVLYQGSYERIHYFYIPAILPAVVLKDKSRLPDLFQHIEKKYQPNLLAFQYARLAYFLTGQERLDYLEKSVAAFSYFETDDIIHILTDVADYATPDLIPHVLRWLTDYPVAFALEKLGCKIVENDAWLEQGFAIAQKIDESVHGFIRGIAPSLDKVWIAKAVIFVMERDVTGEQEKCMPVLVERWAKLSQQEIYAVWQVVLEEMIIKGYTRPRVLTQLSWFSDIIIRLAGTDHTVNVLKEILTVWSWWDVMWQKPANYPPKPSR